MELKNNHFTYPLKVSKAHLDNVNHVNNVVYVQWIQDAAEKHWQAFVSEKLNDDVLWIIRRHEVDYFNAAFLDDELLIHTWTGEYTNITWLRYCEVTRPSDNKKIISAKTTWIPLDRKTQRPKKITEDMIMMFA